MPASTTAARRGGRLLTDPVSPDGPRTRRRRRAGLSLLLTMAVSSLGGKATFAAPSSGLDGDGHAAVRLDGAVRSVRAVRRDGRITRLYGHTLAHGADAVTSAETFLDANTDVLGVERDTLMLPATGGLQPIMPDRVTGGSKFTAVRYEHRVGGVPVFRSSLRLLVRNDEDHPLVLASSSLRDVRGFEPALTAVPADAIDLGRQTAELLLPGLAPIGEPRLVVWAGTDDAPGAPALALEFIGQRGTVGDADLAQRLYLVDAASGAVLHDEDLVLHADVSGRVQGLATQGWSSDECGSTGLDPMPYARVNVGSVTAFADADGAFVIPNQGSGPVTVESPVRGRFFRVTNQGGPNSVVTQTVTPPAGAELVHNSVQRWFHAPLSWETVNVAGTPVLGVFGKVFYRGTDGRMHNFYWENDAWRQGALNWDAPGNAASDPVLEPDADHVYYRGTDGRMWNYYWDGSRWQYAPLSWDVTNVAGAPVLGVFGKVFYRGTDGRMHNFYWSGGAWQNGALNWEAPGNAASDPVLEPDADHVYYRGTDGRLWNYYWDGSRWQNAPLSWDVTNVAGTPVLGVFGKVFYRGTDGRMHNFYWQDGAWRNGALNWEAPGNAASDPVLEPDADHLYYRGTDGRLWNYYWDGSRWQNAPLSWDVANVDGTPVIGPLGKVYYRGTDDRVYNFYWQDDAWQHDALFWEAPANAASDPVVDPAAQHVFYGGTDGRLWNHWWSWGPIDELRQAEVNAYIHANRVRDFVLDANPAYPVVASETDFPINVNLDSDCNAYYTGWSPSMNFFTSGGGCTNSALSTIVYHEYGHHLVNVGGSGQGAYGEGMGDAIAVLVTDQPALADGFQGCGSTMRSADNDCQYDANGCSSCGSEIHACGRLLAGCIWSLRNELRAAEPADYRRILADLTVNSILLHDGTAIDSSICADFLTLDDDDGDLENGTPHGAQIVAAFAAHNLHCAWQDGFDGYAPGPLVGQGGWEAWGGDEGAAGFMVTEVRARTGGQSLAIDGDDDAVHPYIGYEADAWRSETWVWVPQEMDDRQFLMLLNTYPAEGWDGVSLALTLDGERGVIADYHSPAALPLARDAWSSIRVDIDFDRDEQSVFYNDQLLLTKGWTNGVDGGGARRLAALDLFGGGSAHAVYYDDLVVTQASRSVCPADINWDQVVDVQDLTVVLRDWGPGESGADLNGDGRVDVIDLLAVVNAWGPCD